jgi:hypothetical protein
MKLKYRKWKGRRKKPSWLNEVLNQVSNLHNCHCSDLMTRGEGDKNNSTDFFIAEVPALDLEMLMCFEPHAPE